MYQIKQSFVQSKQTIVGSPEHGSVCGRNFVEHLVSVCPPLKMVLRFFSTHQLSKIIGRTDDQEPESAMEDVSRDQMMLLSGPPNCGKTSLLFQFAYNLSLQSCQPVVFICNKQRMDNNPPFLSQEIDPASEVFSRIRMKYVKTDDEIRKYFAAFHLHGTLPAAVIIDNFGDLFHDRISEQRHGNARGKDLAMVRTLALCQDAMDYVNKAQQEQPTRLLISDTHYGDSPRLLFIYKRWLPCIFTIKSNGMGSFLLARSSANQNSEKTVSVKYSVTLQFLVLEGIVKE